jgi:predicted AlkP superfamily pyrophosphatase or phosphodiesterase
MSHYKSHLKTTFLLLVCALMSACASLPPQSNLSATIDKPSLVLISIDGFRADYIDRGVSPNLKLLADGGVVAAMRASFPTLTFPNHYAIVTGKVPDHNGIVNNTMRDKARPDAVFQLSRRDQVGDRFWWDDATPFWVSAQRKSIRTSINWPGAEAAIQGVRPSFWSLYDPLKTSQARVDELLTQFDLPPEQRPLAATLYFDVVDTQGHNFGPQSREVNQAISDVDQAIGNLIQGIKARGLDSSINIIVVSDHGMADISASRLNGLSDIVPLDSFDLVSQGPVATLNPKPGFEALLSQKLIGRHAHMQCWAKARMPRALRYGTHRRVPEIVCAADLGWLIVPDATKGSSYKAGAHGYDPRYKDMASIFIAQGPAFKSGISLKSFDNVDVYSLIMRLIRLKPEAGDGRLQPLKPAFK